MKMIPQQQVQENFEVNSYVYDDLTDQIVERHVLNSRRPSSNLGKRQQLHYPVQDDLVSQISHNTGRQLMQSQRSGYKPNNMTYQI